MPSRDIRSDALLHLQKRVCAASRMFVHPFSGSGIIEVPEQTCFACPNNKLINTFNITIYPRSLHSCINTVFIRKIPVSFNSSFCFVVFTIAVLPRFFHDVTLVNEVM